jgi:hypothetical protein
MKTEILKSQSKIGRRKESKKEILGYIHEDIEF